MERARAGEREREREKRVRKEEDGRADGEGWCRLTWPSCTTLPALAQAIDGAPRGPERVRPKARDRQSDRQRDRGGEGDTKSVTERKR